MQPWRGMPCLVTPVYQQPADRLYGQAQLCSTLQQPTKLIPVIHMAGPDHHFLFMRVSIHSCIYLSTHWPSSQLHAQMQHDHTLGWPKLAHGEDFSACTAGRRLLTSWSAAAFCMLPICPGQSFS